jgi:hypothetical protein
LSWSNGTVAQLAHASRRYERALDAVTVPWRGRPGLTGGHGVAHPTGTPRGSDNGCTEQDGVVGFSPETAGGGGAEKMVRHGGGALVAGEGVDEVLQLEEEMGR